MAFRFRRRRSGPASALSFVLALLVVGGWGFYRSRKFSSACMRVAPGTPAAEAVAELERLGGRRVTYVNQRPNTVELRIKGLGTPDKNCTVEYTEDGLVVKTSGASSLRL